MAQATMDGLLLGEMLMAGAALLEQNREAVDALNVFPVPDGDTGTNMSLTVMAAVREISSKEHMRAGDAAEAIAKGALRGARGNSGVILSQIFRGFARGLDGAKEITPPLLALALKQGADTAYKAIMKPKEGTILTVARVIGETALAQAKKEPEDLEAMFAAILAAGEAILAKTPEMLPALKQAGVVDAGGRGLLLIYAGMYAALRGEPIAVASVQTTDGVADFHDDHDAIDDIKFAYCTEFLIQNLLPEVKDEDVMTFRRRLSRIGDCVLVVGDLALVKVHVHTNDPGKALQAALSLGELVNLKIENMVEQRRERIRAQEAARPESPCGMVAVSLGEGFFSIFTDLGVDMIVDGGQTMNPSIETLSRAIDSVRAKTVYIFPNNSNVILAAQQAADLSSREVYVIPTKNVAMGVAGVIACQPDLPPEENAAHMTAAAERVKSGMITTAIRDSVFEDLTIHEGDCIGLYNGKIAVCEKTCHEVATKLMEMLVTDDDSLITIFYGEDADESDAAELAAEFQARYALCDVEVHGGGQPVYYYILSVE